jgi:hypothetical protein
MTHARSLAAVALVLAAVGCGATDGLNRVRATGKLTARGKPVAGAMIVFIPDGSTRGPGCWARTAGDGSFTLTDARGFAGGVVPGDYKVTVTRFVGPDEAPLPANASREEESRGRQSMPAKVTRPDSSPLTCTIPPRGGEVTIDIHAELFTPKPGQGKPPEPPADRPGEEI